MNRVCLLLALTCLSLMTAAGQHLKPQISTGSSHGVVLKSDGTVWTWGSNSNGQLGTDAEIASALAAVPGMNHVRAVSAGDYFTVAVKDDGALWAWGNNEEGELAAEGIKSSKTPMLVKGIDQVISASASRQYVLALRKDGSVWYWGEPPLQKASRVPKPVDGLSGVTAVAAGPRHGIALKDDGTVWVWGYHGAGDLGNGSYGVAGLPLAIPGLTGVASIAAGDQTTFALRQDGTIWSIGYGAAGQLGNGATENSTQPSMVKGLRDVTAVAAGAMHVVALKSDGSVWSWGYNHSGQLGTVTVTGEQSTKPVRVDKLKGAVAVAAAANHSVALTASDVWAWGENDDGALGVSNDDLERSSVPVRLGAEIPGSCANLFACVTDGNKVIRVCGVQNEASVEKWTDIQYRYGPENGPPELVYPDEPRAKAPLYFSHEEIRGDYRVTIRFTNGGYTYRVYSGSQSDAGVEIKDRTGKRISAIRCAEHPELFSEYLRQNLPCDPQNPHGVAACRETPYRGR